MPNLTWKGAKKNIQERPSKIDEAEKAALGKSKPKPKAKKASSKRKIY